MRYAMVLDTKKCVGCSDCVIACQTENNIPRGYCRDWVTEVVTGRYPEVGLEFRSERCNHCDNAPCVRCCPTGASQVAEGGTVIVDKDLCIGCAACITSCPYDARYQHPEGYVDKCTFCLHRTSKGQLPACASVCPTKCIYFGDLDDPGSEVSQLLASRESKVLTEEAGTKPQVYYLT